MWCAAEDADGDGYTASGAGVEACTPPDGSVSTPSDQPDCDDSNATAYPGAPIVCSDGITNDCNGTVEDEQAACELMGIVDISNPDARLEMTDPRMDFGAAHDFAGDIDGDGHMDLIIGDSDADPDGVNPWDGAGHAWLLRGPFSGNLSYEPDTPAIVGGDRWDGFGAAVVGLGDYDGDGFDDFAVGAPGARDAYIFSGGTTTVPTLDDALTTISARSSDFSLGSSLAAIGDYNNDGLADLLVSGQYNDAAYVVLGPHSGAVSTSRADAQLVGPGDNAIGDAIDSAGDFDGDGTSDIVVGSVNDSTGRVCVAEGGLLGTQSLDDAITCLTGPELRSYFGTDVRGVGDVNLDGLDDILVLSEGDTGDRRSAYIVFGGTDSFTTVDRVDTLRLLADFRSIAYAGDFNNDGDPDLALGVVSSSSPYTGSGPVFVLYGPHTETGTIEFVSDDDADLVLTLDDEQVPNAVLVGGNDINNDGVDDLLLGSSTALFVVHGAGR